jgi:hypothetical protein
MQVTPDAQQAAWDVEQCSHYRKLLKRLAAKVRDAQARLDERRKEAQAASRARGAADRQLTAAVEADAEDLAQWAGQVRQLTVAAEAAVEKETEARQHLVQARAAKRNAQDELRAETRRWLRPLPLFDAHDARRPAAPENHSRRGPCARGKPRPRKKE